MLAVGIDISKSKSVAAILNQDGSMHTSPFEFHHTQPELDAFIKYILNSKQSATILMENTGHYHYPVLKAFQEAGLPVCMVNAYQIKKFGDMDLRKAKTDKKDAVRIARYALEKSYSLVPYTSMEQKYEDLRFLARQYNQRMLFSNSVLSVAMFTKDSSNLMELSKKFRKLHHSSKMAVLSSCCAN